MVDAEVADVVFLRDADDGAICAVFPGLAAIANNPSSMVCYAHIGQHGCTFPEYCDVCEEVTDREEYADLAAELECIGYVLHVVSKSRMGGNDYAATRSKQVQL